MAKNVSIAEALSVLAEAGINLGEEHAEAIKELTTAAFKSRAVAIFEGNGENLPGKLREDSSSDGDAWATQMFLLAESMVEDLIGETKSVQGGGVRMVRVVGIDTPYGHLKVELRSE